MTPTGQELDVVEYETERNLAQSSCLSQALFMATRNVGKHVKKKVVGGIKCSLQRQIVILCLTTCFISVAYR